MAQYVRPTLGQAIDSGSARGTVGKYFRLETVIASGSPITGSLWYATGSYFGASAFMVSGSPAGEVAIALGGTLDLATLSNGVVYEFEPRYVSESSGNGSVYVLYGHSR